MAKYKDGSVYEGNWKEDVINGYGSLKMADKKYDGYWKDGAMHGHGELVWKNGMQYFGEFKDGIVSGKGRLTSSDGSYFDGTWSDGKKSGIGIRYKAATDEKTKEQWYKGKLKKVYQSKKSM